MLIDTGAAFSSINSSAAKRVGVSYLNAHGFSSTSITGAKAPVRVAVLQSLKFAGLTIRNASIQVSEDNPTAAQDGVIGLDVLLKFSALTFTKHRLLVGEAPHKNCENSFVVSSDLFGDIIGINAVGTLFNGHPAVAIIDSGNATAAISPTWWAVQHFHSAVFNRQKVFAADSSGLHLINRGEISGTLKFLGKIYSGVMNVEANYEFGSVDFNIGMPVFYGKGLYLDFTNRKMCIYDLNGK